MKRLRWLLLFVSLTLVMGRHAAACEATTACEKCAKNSEFSWNPSDESASARLSRFYAIREEMEKAYLNKEFAVAERLAKENMELAAIYRCNWNYGNAIHETNRILGWISLQRGDVDAATNYLRMAGKSTGSPQLDTFGPELDLANELLKRGKTDPVVGYLRDIQSFWKMDNGQVYSWLIQIEKGERPELHRFAAQRPKGLMAVAMWLPLFWPLFATLSFLYTARKRLHRKIAFFFAAIVLGYAAMMAANWLVMHIVRAIFSINDEISDIQMIAGGIVGSGLPIILSGVVIWHLSRVFSRRDAPIDP